MNHGDFAKQLFVEKKNDFGTWFWPMADLDAFGPISDEAKHIPTVISTVRELKATQVGYGSVLNVIQAGGNAGMFPILMSRDGRAHVLTFEMLWPNYSAMVRNLDEHSASVVPIYGALMEKSGFVVPTVESNERFNFGAWYAKASTIERATPSFQLADFSHFNPQLIWLDTEGSEPLIICGSYTILKNKPVLIVEMKGLSERYGYSDRQFDQWLNQVGYRKAHSWGRDVMYVVESELNQARTLMSAVR